MGRENSGGARVAIVGATSLKGKELKEVLESRAFAIDKLTLLDDAEAAGTLTENEGEPAVVNAVSPEVFSENDLVFFSSSGAAYTRACWPQAKAGTAALIDLTHALLDIPEAVLHISADGREETPDYSARWHVAPHPAAAILLTLLARLDAAFGLRQAVANVFEPVSEYGAAGINELQEQTVKFLSFKDYPKAVFDAQVAFNLLSRYGESARGSLEDVEEVIRRTVERCSPSIAERLVMRVAQAPVFHGQCVSLLAELERTEDAAKVEEVLRIEGIEVAREGYPPVTVVEAAGREEILVDRVRRDRSRPASFWLWVAADNFRLQASTAVKIAEHVLA